MERVFHSLKLSGCRPYQFSHGQAPAQAEKKFRVVSDPRIADHYNEKQVSENS